MTQYQRPSNGESMHHAVEPELLHDEAAIGRTDSSDNTSPVVSGAGEVVMGAMGWGCELHHPSAFFARPDESSFAAGGVG